MDAITEQIRNELNNYYDPYMGNFAFTENELFTHMNQILLWLEHNESYALIYQYNEAYEGKNWYLTPQETLY